MSFRFSRSFSFRIRTAGGRLLCQLAVPPAAGMAEHIRRELVLVASPTVPHLRRLMVYRRLAEPDGRPRAA